ncbi:ribbon-helix-helix domain-containing protein [Vibrio sp. 1-Bac 57]
MKIIDDEQFFEYQSEWFKTQFKKGDSSGVWIDFKGVEHAFKMDRYGSMFEDVTHVRKMLNEVGLKRLNNAISARRKRINQTDKKSVQLTLDKNVASKLKLMAETKGMTQSEIIEGMITGEIQMDLFK